MMSGHKEIKNEIIKAANMGGWTRQPLASTEAAKKDIAR